MPTVYRSTDADAPVLTGLVGSLITVLDACLVNGYTDRPAAGWTKAFSGTNKAAYRNDHTAGASGAYFLVEDDAPGSTSGGDSRLRAYGTMSAIDAGTDDTDPEWFRKGAASGDARPWVLAADGMTFWLYSWDNGDSTGGDRDANMCGAGDYICIDAENAFRYFVIGNESSGDTPNRFYARRSSLIAQTVNPDGVSGKTRVSTVPPPNSFTASQGNGGSSSPDSSFTSAVHFDEFIIHSGQQLLGRLRGVKRPINNMLGIAGIERGQEVASTGLIWTMVNASGAASGSANLGAMMIDTAGPW